MIKGLAIIFSVFIGSAAFGNKTLDTSLCRQKIAKSLCLVIAPEDFDQNQNPAMLPCSPGGENYLTFFEGHFDRSNPLIQKMYCHIDKILVTDAIPGSAMSISGYALPNVTVGATIAVRKELLDAPMTFDQWISWKEETSFGGSASTQGTPMGLINYKSNRNTQEFALDFLLNHEFGHLFDFANRLRSEWSKLSWDTNAKPLAQYDFFNRQELCFYFCNGRFADPNMASTSFEGLLNTSFATLYAASGAADDWADTFALYVMSEEQGLQLEVETQGQHFDITSHFYSEKLAAKREFIRKFLEGNILFIKVYQLQ